MLDAIKPSPEEEERIISTANSVLERVQEEVRRRGVRASPILVGSVAKGTFLRDPDIDVFIRFSPEYSREEMEKIGLEIARSVMPDGVESYAEHPYLRGVIDGLRVDIVPCFMVEDPSKRISAVDRTPFHTEFVLANLRDEQRDEVRILKAFMKGIGVYGAEARVRGFSGYLCELLIIKYGTFLNVLRNAARWKRKTYIHLGNGGKKFPEPLVFVDPVDGNRNVASAVSEESKSLFTLASMEFLKSPSKKFFFPPPPRKLSREEILSAMRERGTKFYAVIFPRPRVIDDVLYPQIRRTMKAFQDILGEFIVLNTYHAVSEDHVAFILELERDELPEVQKHEGPPVWHGNAHRFLEKWRGTTLRGPYIEGSRLYVDRKRTLRTVEEVLRKGLENYKIGKHFEKRKDRMISGPLEDLLDHVDPESISGFFAFTFPWER